MAFSEDPFGTDDAFMLPELPSPDLRDPNVCQFITHHDGSELILSAESAGIPKSRFNLMFDFVSNTQILCASRNCTNTGPVESSTHRCGCCGARYHSYITCNTVSFRDLVCTSGFEHGMLYRFGLQSYCKWFGDFNSCPLQVCDICHDRVNREIVAAMPRDVDGLMYPQSPRIVDGFAATTESTTALMTTAITGQRSVLLPTSLVTEVGTAYDTTAITGLPAISTGLPSVLLPTSRVTEEGNTDDTTAITGLPSVLLHTSLIIEEGTADDTVPYWMHQILVLCQKMLFCKMLDQLMT